MSNRNILQFSYCISGVEYDEQRGLDKVAEMFNSVFKNSTPEMSHKELITIQSGLIYDLMKLDEKTTEPFIVIFKQIMRDGNLNERLISAPLPLRDKIKKWSAIEQASAIFKAQATFNGVKPPYEPGAR